jgi:beta-N-acetylhexosaminidase
MLAHVVYKDIDPDWPASLSTRIGKDLLRRQIGFRGVTITDDLDMGAIVRHYGVDTVIERIFAAEIDVALICRNGKTVKDSHKKLMEAAYASDEARDNHLMSAERILALKERFIGQMRQMQQGSVP